MRYAVVTCTNGAFLIRTEHSDKESAFAAFHSLCATLYKDASMAGKKGMVKVLDENLDCVEGKLELIDRTNEDTQQTPVEETEPEG